MGVARDLVETVHSATHCGCAKVNETIISHVANATAKVKATVKSRTSIATDYLSDPKSRDSLSKFATNASINAAKNIPGGVGVVVDIVAQSIPEKKKENHDDKYKKRIEALEDEIKELRHKKELKPCSPTSKL